MEITLENIRCHEKATFTFPEKGLVLLQGLSGQGKSTILDGVAFALFGSSKKNLVTYGQKKCKVTMKYKSWTITRTKSPNRLTFIDGDSQGSSDEVIYEDDGAQEIINEKFGKFFTITSYVTQLNKDSFLYLSPADKMSFLEQLAFGDIDITDLKNKCKTKVKDRKERLAQKNGFLQATITECSLINEPEEVPFPLTGNFSAKKVEKQKEKRIENRQNLEGATNKLIDMNKKLAEQTLNRQKYDRISEQIDQTTQERKRLEEELSTIKITPINEIEEHIEYLKANKDLTVLKNTLSVENQNYQAFSVIELQQLKDSVDELQKFPAIDNNISALEILLKNKKDYVDYTSSIKSIKNELNELDDIQNYDEAIADLRKQEQDLLHKKLKLKDRKIIHRCPKCTACLRIGSSGLELADEVMDDIKLDTKDIEKELSTVRSDIDDYLSSKQQVIKLSERLTLLENKISSLQPVDMSRNYEQELSEHKQELFQQQERLKKITLLEQKINNKEFSGTVQALKRKIQNLEAEIKGKELLINKYSSTSISETDIDKLQSTVYDSKLKLQKQKMLSHTLNSLIEKINTLTRELSLIPIDDENYALLLEGVQQEISTMKKKEIKYSRVEKELELYLEYRAKKKEYDKWQDKLNVAKEIEKNARDSLAVAEKLLRKIQETESASVIGIIDTINHHMSHYLEKFFIDPIEVEIRSFKETSKDTKPSINIYVGYKGMETEVNCLSGGERARIEVAICLALNAMVGSNMILLDESLGPLDQGTIEIILDVLKQEAQEEDKLIITVLHQAVEGIFDQVISLMD